MTSVTSTTGIDPSVLASLGGTTSTANTAATTEKKEQSLGQAEFLELMIAQLKNQDPFNPVENEQFVAQMAQFSTVAGISEMNTSLKDISAGFDQGRIATATGYVGKSVLVPGSTARADDDGAISGTIDVPSAVSNLALTVIDETGKPVRRIDLGSQGAGSTAFRWDGTDDNGDKVDGDLFGVVATASIGGETQALGTNVYGRVRSVNLPTSGGAMTVEVDGLGEVGVSQVLKVGA